jgi:hypothetical protein
MKLALLALLSLTFALAPLPIQDWVGKRVLFVVAHPVSIFQGFSKFSG